MRVAFILVPMLLAPALALPPPMGGAGLAFGEVPAVGADVTVDLAATSFGALTTIDAFSGEPNIAAGPDGTVYVTGLGWNEYGGGTMVFRRLNGSSNFESRGMPDQPFGGSDEALAVAPDGTVWISGMYRGNRGFCASATRSIDRGTTWSVPIDGICLDIGIDRQWLAVDAANRPWIALHENCCLGQHTAYRSDDGATFLPRSVTSASSGFPGNLFIDRVRGLIYEATNCVGGVTPQGPCVLASSVEAPTPVWTLSLVARYSPLPTGLAHVTGAVDDAGTIYMTWIDGRGSARNGVWVARSTTFGQTWEAPQRVSDPTKLGTMPWIVAGTAGNVAVVWFETSATANDPNSAPLHADWHVKAATIMGWTAPAMPAPSITQLSSTPAKTGRICTLGAGCQQHRELLDFFEAAIGPTGTLHVVWPEVSSQTLKVADVDARLRD